MGVKYDIGGWATRNDIKCLDGRTIRQNAFKECDGKTVPIVWSHIHDDPDLVLGHALLENRPEGVYMHGKFNDSPKGQQVKRLIEHGDVVGLSIWANHLKQNGGDVLHGSIKEVSVVLAGANPGAFIDSVSFAHGDEESEDEAIITTGEPIYLMHADDDEEEEKKVEEESEEEKTPAKEEPEETKKPEEKEESKEMAEPKEEKVEEAKTEEKDETVEDVFNSLTDKQKTVVYALVAQLMDEKNAGSDEEDDEEDEEDMKHNVFENEVGGNVLSHDDMQMIFSDAQKMGSLREAYLAHEDEVVGDSDEPAPITYGIKDIDYLFPDARAIDNVPQFIKRNDEWVNVVINGTHHTPFSRIKSVFANITEDEARAKGYIKGTLKKNEVFTLLKRTTEPQTIYKKQKMDRDDILDITDFDVVAWIRGEMRMMLNEEIARAILIGDGRLSDDDDHIKDDRVRPIATDADLYTIKVNVANDEDVAKNLIKAAIRARKDYKGSGSPTMFIGEDLLTEMMLIEDTLGRPMYESEADLAKRMRVSKIVPVPLMSNATNGSVAAIIVNLTDYNVGADKGGEINMFDDFDIDYNQQKYLLETRISGALVRPYSAIALKLAGAS